METITLELTCIWNEIRKHRERTIHTVQGVRLDPVNLKQVIQENKECSLLDNRLTFPITLLPKPIENYQNTILYLRRKNWKISSGYVWKTDNNIIYINFFDAHPIIGFQVAHHRFHFEVSDYGIGYEGFFDLLEKLLIIERVTVFAFIVINDEALFNLIGRKKQTIEDVMSRFKK